MKQILQLLVVILIALSAQAQQSNSMFHQQLDWSSDGKLLVFTAMTDYDPKTDAYRSDIYSIKADGSQRQRISGQTKKAFYASWSRDGRVVFGADVEGSKDSNLFTANQDGTDVVQLTRNSARNATPAFSPNGKLIAFISTRDSEKHQIYVMAADGTSVRRLTTDSSIGYYNPMWSPDGKKIVYYTEKGDRRDQVWVMNADGSDQTLLTGGVGHNIFPAFSPDGKRIIFSSSNREGGDASYVDGSYLYTMNLDGSNLTPLSHIRSFFARYSPNGRKIAFIAGKFPNSAIYVVDANGRHQTLLSGTGQ